MITRLQVKNYRSLADVDVQLEPLTVLVGPNGSGKSNLVDVLRFVAVALQRGLGAAVIDRHGMSALRRWSAKGCLYDVEIGLSLEDDTLAGEYRFILGGKSPGEYRVKAERCQLRVSDEPEEKFETEDGQWVNGPVGMNPAVPSTALVLPLLAGSPPFKMLYDFLTGMSFYNVLPDVLKKPQKPAYPPYPLDERGENLATVLQNMLNNWGYKTLNDLAQALSRVTMGDIQNYRVDQTGDLVTKLQHAAAEDEQGPLFELFQESDGTLRMLGILTALYQQPPRTLIALEEPELTIHPGAMALLWEEIYSAAKHSQILITTHSPDLLDLCRAEQLRVVEKIDGVTHIGPIAEEQKQAIQQRLFAPGQLLQAQGLWRAVEA
jgi:predicted ATPase